MQVSVRDNNVDQALRVLKKKLQREGVFREMKLKQHFEKPEAGKLVMWPCDWTHLHRGITSPTETKYIITGWFSWVENHGNSNYEIVKKKNEKS